MQSSIAAVIFGSLTFTQSNRNAQVSTTANIYAHVMEEADQKNADILADVFLKKA